MIRDRSYRFSTRLYAKHSHAWACADFAFHSRCFYATHRLSFFAFRRSTIGLVLHNTRCVVLFFRSPRPPESRFFRPLFSASPTSMRFFRPRFFLRPRHRVHHANRTVHGAFLFFPLYFRFFFVPLLLLFILLFYPLNTFYLFVHRWEIVLAQSSVSLISIFTLEIN